MAAPTNTKKQTIDKTNSFIITTIAVTCFIVIFTIVAGRALLIQRAYQARVISKKELARDTLKKNEDAVTQLKTQYQVFATENNNVIGGVAQGTGDRDGDNAKIILDALPSKYDFPALATSITKITQGKGFEFGGMVGKDDELAQISKSESITPVPISIPFDVQAKFNTIADIDKMLEIFENSIRPIKINSITLQATQGASMSVKAETYYQPTKKLGVTEEVVK